MLPYFQHLSNQAHRAQFQYLYAYRHQVWTKVLPSQHGAFVGVQSSSGALKHLALKYKSEMFNCILPINALILKFILQKARCYGLFLCFKILFQQFAYLFAYFYIDFRAIS